METTKINFKDVTIGALLVAVIWLASAGGILTGGIHQDGSDTSAGIFSVASSTGDTYFFVGGNGKVGINNTAPETQLDVEGTIRAYNGATTTGACTSNMQGAIQYSGYYQHFLGCNGSAWVQLEN